MKVLVMQYSRFAQMYYINIRATVENCMRELRAADFHIDIIVDMINNEYGSQVVTKKQVQAAVAATKRQYANRVIGLGYGWYRWA